MPNIVMMYRGNGHKRISGMYYLERLLFSLIFDASRVTPSKIEVHHISIEYH